MKDSIELIGDVKFRTQEGNLILEVADAKMAIVLKSCTCSRGLIKTEVMYGRAHNSYHEAEFVLNSSREATLHINFAHAAIIRMFDNPDNPEDTPVPVANMENISLEEALLRLNDYITRRRKSNLAKGD